MPPKKGRPPKNTGVFLAKQGKSHEKQGYDYFKKKSPEEYDAWFAKWKEEKWPQHNELRKKKIAVLKRYGFREERKKFADGTRREKIWTNDGIHFYSVTEALKEISKTNDISWLWAKFKPVVVENNKIIDPTLKNKADKILKDYKFTKDESIFWVKYPTGRFDHKTSEMITEDLAISKQIYDAILTTCPEKFGYFVDIVYRIWNSNCDVNTQTSMFNYGADTEMISLLAYHMLMVSKNLIEGNFAEESINLQTIRDLTKDLRINRIDRIPKRTEEVSYKEIVNKFVSDAEVNANNVRRLKAPDHDLLLEECNNIPEV